MFYFSCAVSVKGEGLVNVGLFACGVSSSSSTWSHVFVFLTLLMLVFFCVGGGWGDPWYC